MLLRRYRVVKTQPVATSEPVANTTEPIETNEEATTKYSRTEISRMNKAELVELASNNGLETDDKSGAELKEMLLEHFDL